MKLRVAMLLLALTGAAAAQDLGSLAKPSLSKSKTPTQRVVAMPPKTVAIRPGSNAEVEMAFQVKPGFHINSNKPGSDLLLPTVVKLSPPTNIGVGSLEYPPGREQSFEFSPNEKLSVYTGDFTVTGRVGAAKNMPAGRFRVHGFLTYQACDDRACYPPTKLPIAFDVKVSGKTTSLSSGSGRRRSRHPQSPDIR